jgi:hypothetical protein
MIAQADSRKWMACLYNSFLFMEAKIMKMAKKLLALVLTGVMAVSMLTGCALSDKVTSEALEKALNKEQVQGTVDIDYKYDNGLNKKASKVWENEMKNKDFTLSNNSLTKVTVDSKDYLYYVVERPEDYKTFGGWITAAKALDTAVGTPAKTVSGTDVKVLDSNKSTTSTKAKVNFGVHYDSKKGTDGKGTKNVNYVVVVFEVAPKA